jgi:mRNA degradation ribonuclease J1/J2
MASTGGEYMDDKKIVNDITLAILGFTTKMQYLMERAGDELSENIEKCSKENSDFNSRDVEKMVAEYAVKALAKTYKL